MIDFLMGISVFLLAWHMSGFALPYFESSLQPTPSITQPPSIAQTPTRVPTSPPQANIPSPTPTTSTIPKKILALGDSITAGFYPCKLRELLPSHYIFVGSQTALYCAPLQHEGHGSFTTKMIRDGYTGKIGNEDVNYPGLVATINSYKPDIVLIHLGTNDIGSGVGIETIVQTLQQIVDTIPFKLSFVLVNPLKTHSSTYPIIS